MGASTVPDIGKVSMAKGILLNPSTQKPKPCRCTNSWLDRQDGRCIRCGRQTEGREVKAPSLEDTIFEIVEK